VAVGGLCREKIDCSPTVGANKLPLVAVSEGIAVFALPLDCAVCDGSSECTPPTGCDDGVREDVVLSVVVVVFLSSPLPLLPIIVDDIPGVLTAEPPPPPPLATLETVLLLLVRGWKKMPAGRPSGLCIITPVEPPVPSLAAVSLK
jgi:hypothetical protein